MAKQSIGPNEYRLWSNGSTGKPGGFYRGFTPEESATLRDPYDIGEIRDYGGFPRVGDRVVHANDARCLGSTGTVVACGPETNGGCDVLWDDPAQMRPAEQGRFANVFSPCALRLRPPLDHPAGRRKKTRNLTAATAAE